MALHEVQLKGYNVRPGNLSLGTFGSYGIEQLHVTLDDTWSGLAVTATFNPPKGEPREIRLPENGLIDVPAEATANEGTGTIVYCGVANGVQRITKTQGYNVITRGPVGGTEPFKPSESLATQVLQAALNAEKNSAEAKSVADNLRNDAANGKFDGKDGAKGDKGDKGDTGDKGNTGAKGDKGDKGFSPTATVTQLENGAEIAITDEEGTTKATVKNGSKGDKGDRGSDGVSPTISVEDIENGHRVTIVDATGTTSVDIYNGEDGTDGKDGAQVDDSAIGEKPWSSKHIIDMLCPPLEESGNPVVCYPVAGYPLGVKASWEPVQEGSGTPYPAGGGKNQLNPAEYEAATKTVNGITFTRSNTGEVVVNGTATGTAIYVLIKNFSYPISLSTDRNWSIAGENVISAQGLVSGVTVTRPSDNTALYVRVESGTTVKTTVQPQIEKGNTPTAWAPYENIRPIKGRDSVRVERCGENLFNKDGVSVGAPVYGENGTISSYKDVAVAYVKVVPGAQYSIRLRQTDSTILYTRIAFLTKSKKFIKRAYMLITKHGMETEKTFTVSADCEWIQFGLNNGRTFNYNFDVVFVAGSAPTTYIPYIGSTNTLTLPETVYGGEVDAVTGEGQETWQILNNPSSYDYYEGAPEGGWSQSEDAVAWYLDNPTLFPYKTKVLSNIFNSVSDVVHTTKPYLIGSASHFIAFRLPRSVAATGNDVKNWLASNDVEIAFEPIDKTPFTATGAQPIPALAGANTVLTDADRATVTGRADPIKRITDLEDATASQT